LRWPSRNVEGYNTKAVALENRECSCIVTCAGYTEGGK
jgi:hypothetical protein